MKKMVQELESRSEEARLVEEMADLAHEIWANWMKYMFSQCIPTEFEEIVCIPMNLAKRWKRQMSTLYKDLSEHEKESDRQIARQYLDIIFGGKK
jgi:hypothetical protein